MKPLNTREKASHGVAEFIETIENNIRSGMWQAGFRLPTERELEKHLGVSRNTLRKGLRRLEKEGKIVRHVGRGSFVADTTPNRSGDQDPRTYKAVVATALDHTSDHVNGKDAVLGAELLQKIRGASPVDIMEVRLLIEPSAAELAAHRASNASLIQMAECIIKMAQASEIKEYEYWDGVLHVTIVSAARNELLSLLYEAINSARHQPEWEELKKRTVTPARRKKYQEQHERVVRALNNRDADKARAEMQAHLCTVRDNLLSL